jgi:hypothetical protein
MCTWRLRRSTFIINQSGRLSACHVFGFTPPSLWMRVKIWCQRLQILIGGNELFVLYALAAVQMIELILFYFFIIFFNVSVYGLPMIALFECISIRIHLSCYFWMYQYMRLLGDVQLQSSDLFFLSFWWVMHILTCFCCPRIDFIIIFYISHYLLSYEPHFDSSFMQLFCLWNFGDSHISGNEKW